MRIARTLLIMALASTACTRLTRPHDVPIPASPHALPASTAAAIDALFASEAARPGPGHAVGVFRDGEIAYAKGFGLANLEHEIPIDADTSFHIASLSKQFTAAAVALLVVRGTIAMDDPIREHLPELPAVASEIQVRHLAYHGSGLPEYTALPRECDQPWQSFFYFTVDEALTRTLSIDRLESTPGTQYAYRNSNFMLLAALVERASGTPFGEFVEQELFVPLGMTHSVVHDDNTMVVPHRATGYTSRSDALVESGEQLGIHLRGGTGWAQVHRNSPHYGGSGVMTSLADLARWDRNFITAEVGGQAMLDVLLAPEPFGFDKTNTELFGLYETRIGGLRAIAYDGSDIDGTSAMARFPDAGVTVVVLGNDSGGNASHEAQRVIQVLLDHGVLAER